MGRSTELGQAVISCPLFISFLSILASSYPFETSQPFPGALLRLGFITDYFIYYFWILGTC